MIPKWLNDPKWYVIQTKPQQEARANHNLQVGGIETFFPQVLKRYKRQTNNRKTYSKPFFPRYLFANFNAYQMYQKVKYTRGVHKVLSFGTTPCIIEDEIINLIKQQRTKDGYINIEKKLRPGDKVKIDKPYLRDFIGIFKKEMKVNDRVSILLTTVTYQVHVIVEKEFVSKTD